MITIDCDDSKDLDDAVSLRKDGENYILGIHIADVSQYVKENGALDKEALKRGTFMIRSRLAGNGCFKALRSSTVR